MRWRRKGRGVQQWLTLRFAALPGACSNGARIRALFLALVVFFALIGLFAAVLVPVLALIVFFVLILLVVMVVMIFFLFLATWLGDEGVGQLCAAG